MPTDEGNLESMLNNPFRNLENLETDAPHTEKPPECAPPPASAPKSPASGRLPSRTELNHPVELRVLSMEKNEFIINRKIDDIKHIIEHQNERIRLLEEELEILRKEPGGRKG
jgi:hypothetical protein